MLAAVATAAGDEVVPVTSSMTSTQDGAARTAVEVRMEGLSRHYGPVVALDKLDLTVQAGELIALLGPADSAR